MSAKAGGDDGGPELPHSPERSNTAPPEKPAALWTRRFILLAFWAVIITLGLPQWIWTTSIHRSNLPLDSMNEWASGTACQLRYPIYIRLKSSTNDSHSISSLASQVEKTLNTQNNSPLYDFHVTVDPPNATLSQLAFQHIDPLQRNYKESALTIDLEADTKAQSTQATLKSWYPNLVIRHNPGRSVDAVTLAPFIAEEVRKIFTDEKTRISTLLNASPFAREEDRVLADAKNTRAFKYASTYHLTFSLFTASATPSAWDIEDAIQENIQPLFNSLSSISRLTVDTQIQFYASFSPSIAGPQYDSSTRQWKLQKTDLSGFVNAAEWPLSPGIGEGPTINFVLYVPSSDQSPLVIAETGGGSWLIPQWGGVQIFNPTEKQRGSLTAEDLRPIMLTFADQLTSLLGVPHSPASMSLRISSLTRERATSLIISASSTLGALARLTLKLTSIAIPDSVAKSVDETIHRLNEACADIQGGRFDRALKNAQIAEEEAEQAFFEPSMVGQVYFPDEHKVAVYVPLLGPMAVPLIMAGIKELKKLKEKKTKVV